MVKARMRARQEMQQDGEKERKDKAGKRGNEEGYIASVGGRKGEGKTFRIVYCGYY